MPRGGKPNLAVRAAVVALANEGYSMIEIGRALGIGVNAAAGHCHRARAAGIHVEHFRDFIPSLQAGQARRLKTLPMDSRKRAQALPGAAAAAGEPSRPAPLPPRHRTCQFIAGEKGRDFCFYAEPGVFCGEPVREGSSWCPAHHSRVHIRGSRQDGAAFVPGTLGTVDTAWR